MGAFREVSATAQRGGTFFHYFSIKFILQGGTVSTLQVCKFGVEIIFRLPRYLRYYYRPSHLNDKNRDAIRNFVGRLKSGEIELLTVSCPNCGTDRGELLFNRDRYGIPWETVVCEECGMLYSNPQMTQDSTRQFYSSDDYRRIYGGGDLLRDSADMFDFQSVNRSQAYHQLTYYDFIKRSEMQIESVAEIGAGGGWNLIPFTNEGIVCQGYDFSPQLINAGRQQGLDMRDLSSTKLSGRYDLIMLRHVLEHVDEPILQLQQLSSHLSENGRLFIEVPGIVRTIPSLQNAHYHYFSETTLVSVLGQAGFEVTDREIIPDNGFLLAMARYTGITKPPIKNRAEYQRVFGIVARGRKGIYKATIVESLPITIKRIIMGMRRR